MTVGELKQLLSSLPDDLDVQIRRPNLSYLWDWYEVDEVTRVPGCSIANPAVEIRTGEEIIW